MEITTKLVQRKAPNPTGKGGFGEHPENRSNGAWDSSNSFSYWMNKFKAMSVEDFKNYETIKPEKERTMAEMLAYARILKARHDLPEFIVVANRTEGMPKQSIEHSGEITEYQANIDQKTQDLLKDFIVWRKKNN